MCGILGFTGEPDPKLLRRMARRLRHRGPDARGFFEDSKVSLGCQRLRIRDPSPAADQPFRDSQGRIIVFNGELFNHSLLRERLERAGCNLRTDCDTETLLASYALWGADCFTRLDGMFAAAIWDPLKKELILSRDSHGIKPLYYVITPAGTLFFASELKALLLIPDLKRHINPNALGGYLTFGCNFLNESLIKGIYRVPPGSVLTVNAEGALSINIFPPQKSMSPPPNSVDALLSVLSEAVDAATQDLDEFGLFLSGGVDSALLLALLARERRASRVIRTYTAAFPSHDESSVAREVAEHFGTEHTAVQVDESHLELLPEIVWYADEALSDPTALPLYLLGQKASRDVKVVLTGDGGDELFYGYEHIRFLYLRQRLIAQWPKSVKKLFAGNLPLVPRRPLNALFPYVEDLGSQGILRAKRYLREEQPLNQYLAMVSIFDEDERRHLGSEPKLDLSGLLSCFRKSTATDIDALARLDSSILLTYGMLPKTDRMTMAHSVEARLPYLSAAVDSASRAIPLNQKLGLFSDKVCLRRAARQILPKQMVGQRKQRFFVPIHTMWKNELIERFKRGCDSQAFQASGLRQASIDRLLSNFHSSPLYYSRQLWNLLSLLLWIETFIIKDGKNPVRPGWW